MADLGTQEELEDTLNVFTSLGSVICVEWKTPIMHLPSHYYYHAKCFHDAHEARALPSKNRREVEIYKLQAFTTCMWCHEQFIKPVQTDAISVRYVRRRIELALEESKAASDLLPALLSGLNFDMEMAEKIMRHQADCWTHLYNTFSHLPEVPPDERVQQETLHPPRPTGDEWIDGKAAECFQKEQAAVAILDRAMRGEQQMPDRVDWERFHKLIDQKIGKRTLGGSAKLLGIKSKELEELCHEQVNAAFFVVCEKLEIEPKSLLIDENSVEMPVRPDTPINLLIDAAHHLERMPFEDDEEKATRLALLNQIYPVLREVKDDAVEVVGQPEDTASAGLAGSEEATDEAIVAE